MKHFLHVNLFSTANDLIFHTRTLHVWEWSRLSLSYPLVRKSKGPKPLEVDLGSRLEVGWLGGGGGWVRSGLALSKHKALILRCCMYMFVASKQFFSLWVRPGRGLPCCRRGLGAGSHLWVRPRRGLPCCRSGPGRSGQPAHAGGGGEGTQKAIVLIPHRVLEFPQQGLAPGQRFGFW